MKRHLHHRPETRAQFRYPLLRVVYRDAARTLADRLERQLQLAGLDELEDTDIEDFPESGEER